MSSAPFLTSIYLSLLYPVLNDWVAVEDFTVLDTSICNKKNREFFLTQVTSENFTHSGNIQYNRLDYLEWLCAKGLRVKNINISRYTEKKLNKQILAYFGKLKFIERIETKFCSNLFRLLNEFQGLISGIVLMDSFDLVDEDLVTISTHPKLSQIGSITILECDITTKGFKCMNSTTMPNLNFVEIYYCDNMTSEWVSHLATEYTSNLKHIISDKADDASLTQLATHCPNLETLNVNQSEITGPGLIPLVEKCHKLTWLDLESVADMSDAVVSAIAEHCPALKILHLSFSENITDSSILKLADYCKHLMNISLNNCALLTDVSLIALFQACPLMQVVDLNQCALLTDKCVIAAHKHCPRIDSFDIGGTAVTEAVVPLFVPEHMELFRLIQIEHYHGPNCNCGAVGANHDGLFNVEDEEDEVENEEVNGDPPAGSAFGEALSVIGAQALEGLTSAVQALRVDDHDDETEDEDEEDEEDWESVDGSDDEDEDDEDEDDEDDEDDDDDGSEDGGGEIEDDQTDRFAPEEDLTLTFTVSHSGGGGRDKYRSLVAREPDFDVSESRLREMLLAAGQTLQVVAVHFGHLSVTDATVEAIIEGCPHVHSLSLTECNVTAEAWLHVAKRYGPQLKVLECDGCLSMTDSMVSSILAHVPNLHTLSVRGCNKLTGVSLESVVTSCKKLLKLDIGLCKLITNSSVIALIEAFRAQLQHLSMDHCSVNSRVLNEIACQCEDIKFINVKGCKDVLDSGECVARLLQSCPTLVTFICEDGVYRFCP